LDGFQIFSLMLRPNNRSRIKANLVTKGKSYTNNEEFCVNDSYVIIRCVRGPFLTSHAKDWDLK
jgi:hypothetical protein